MLQGGGECEADLVGGDDLCGYETTGGFHVHERGGNSRMVCKGGDASGAIATHFCFASVRVEELHPKVSCLAWRMRDNQAFGSGTGFTGTHAPDEFGRQVGTVGFDGIDDDEIVASTVHFPEVELHERLRVLNSVRLFRIEG